MRKINVLYIAETTSGGSAYSLLHLVREIRKSNYRPLVLFIKVDNPDVYDKIKRLGIEIISFDKKQLGGSQAERKKEFGGSQDHVHFGERVQKILGKKAAEIYYSIKSFYYFLRFQAPLILPIVGILRKRKIRLIHLNSGLQNGLGAIVSAKLMGVPIVCHARMFSKWSGFEVFFAKLTEKFIYISDAVAKHFYDQGVPPSKGVVIYNALDLSEFNPESNGSEVRSEFGWNSGEKIIGVVGRVAAWKGQEFFIRALSECCYKYPMIRGLIIGEHSHYKRGKEFYAYLKSLAEDLEIAEKVKFTGFRGDIPLILSALDIVIHCSIKPEPFGRVVIEGMSCAKPVIATAAGGVPEIISDNVTGLLVPCGDSAALADAIDKILSEKEKARKLGIAARKKVEKMFSIQKHILEIQHLYETVLRKSSS